MSQHPDKDVDFSENQFDSPCGCLMVQYGKENHFEFSYAGFSSWGNYPDGPRKNNNFYRLETHSKYYHFCENEDSFSKTTYGKIQAYCRKHFNLDTGEKLNEISS